MSLIDFVFGKKQISVKNCSRDPSDPRVTKCDIIIHESSGGIVRKGEISGIADNKIIHPLSSRNLTDEEFRETINFLNRGGWSKIVPQTKILSEQEE